MYKPSILSIIASVLFAILGQSVLAASPGTGDFGVDEHFLRAVMEHYSLTEEETVERLAREAEATVLYRQIMDLPMEGYAGSWFDDSTWTLKVASSEPNDLRFLDSMPIDPVTVDYNCQATPSFTH